MKRIFTKISILCVLAAATLAVGCLKDETKRSSGGGGSTDPVIPDNSVIDARMFEALNLDAPGLEGVKTLYAADQHYLAAQALLEFYRSRTTVTNGNVNLIAPTISSEEQLRADYALLKNDYRFYVEGYVDGDKPYSYASSKKVDWTKCATNETGQHRGLHRMQWMIAQGKAYRTSLDETYAKEFFAVYEDWFKTHERPVGEGLDYDADPASQPEEIREQLYAWRPLDVAYRLEDQCDLLYYFMHSSNMTPQWFSLFMSNMVEQADHVLNHFMVDQQAAEATPDKEALVKEAHSVFRAGTIFPEMKSAAEWVKNGEQFMNNGVDTKIFDVLNLEYSGLTKVANAHRIGDYVKALDELLAYYRTRTHGRNPMVDLSVSPTANDRRWADMALKENDYRFYVKNFFDPSAAPETPYSYKSGEGIDWKFWPTKDQEQRYQLHRHQWMLSQAKTYYATKDERYAENFVEVYLDWFRQNPKPDIDLDYTKYPENQAPAYRNAGWTWRPLDVAARVMDHCAALEYYQDSPTITVERLSQLLQYMDQQVNHIIRNYSKDSNHLITQAQAVTFAGLLFPELKNAAEWVTSGSGVLNNEVTRQYYSDGWLMDGDLHYHIAGIEDFRSAMLAAQLNGQAHRFPQSYVEAMRKMTDVVMNMVYPNYTVPNMTDTRRDTWSKSVLTRNLTNYANLFPDNAQMLWLATQGVSGTKPEYKAKTFADAGYYVLRSGWGMTDMMMVLQNTTSSPKEKWHRQWDNNTFELFVNGRQFFPDSGCFTYGGSNPDSNTDRQKYAATKAHNTLTLDGKNVTTCRGVMLKQETKSTSTFNYEVLVLENPSYANLTHRRAIFLVNNKFYVVVDEAYGDAAGVVNLNFNLCEGNDSEVVLDLDQKGAHTAFGTGANLMVRTLAPASMPIVAAEKEGFVSYQTDKSIARKAYQVNMTKKADQRAARFITVLLPMDQGAAEVGAATFDGDWNSGATTVRVTVNGVTYKLNYTL